MQKSYVAKTVIHLVDYKFYVRAGDLLVYDTGNGNRLTIHRNGEIVKVVKQDPLGIASFLKNKFIAEPLQVSQDTEPILVKDTPYKEEKKKKHQAEEIHSKSE